MNNKKYILGIMATSIISAGILSACGNGAAEEQKNENSVVEIENVSETDAEKSEERSFGLQDYEGLYCMTTTEKMDGFAFDIVCTYGYLFNGDGTGVYYGQDVVDITWNESEIHFADSTENYTMESGKLTVNDVTYDKIAGNFIAPEPTYVDVDNIDNGIYYVSIDDSGISETDGQVTVRTEIYTVDSYDIVDVNRMAAGDVIYVNGELMPVETVDKLESGAIEINGGVENMGSALRPEDESNCYVFFGIDDLRSFTRKGVTELTLSDNAKLIDNSDPTETKESTGSDVVAALKKLVENYPLYCYDCKITVEEGAIVEINRMYTP